MWWWFWQWRQAISLDGTLVYLRFSTTLIYTLDPKMTRDSTATSHQTTAHVQIWTCPHKKTPILRDKTPPFYKPLLLPNQSALHSKQLQHLSEQQLLHLSLSAKQLAAVSSFTTRITMNQQDLLHYQLHKQKKVRNGQKTLLSPTILHRQTLTNQILTGLK